MKEAIASRQAWVAWRICQDAAALAARQIRQVEASPAEIDRQFANFIQEMNAIKPMTKFALAAFAAAALIPATALAQSSGNQGYVVDASGNVVTSSTGLCWHDSDWTLARSVEPCDPINKPLAAAPALAPKAAAPPAAATQPVAATPLPQKISFSADALFAFDKSALKPEGKAMLDDLVRQLNGTTYDVIHVTGHADRLGSAGYDQKLSVRRANEVKVYLMSRDILAGRIEAKGMGETQPIIKAGECKDMKRADVIACLQPDRRVDIEMEGTKTMTSPR